MGVRFSKAERLKGKVHFAFLAKEGNVIKESFVRLKWLPDNNGTVRAQVAFSVPKRNVKGAVERNRIKRQMRAIYRSLKPELYECLALSGMKASFLFVYLGPEKVESDKLRHIIERLLLRWKQVNANIDQ
jgi:ribonuclease P protein component